MIDRRPGRHQPPVPRPDARADRRELPERAFTTGQLQALALVFLRLNGYAFDTYLVFFGAWCVLIGYLIFRSTFLPRILGVLLAIDGLGWMTYLSPQLGSYLFPVIAVAAGIAEIPLPLWLLVVGVNAQRWHEQAAAGAPIGAQRESSPI